ncbi:trigger factor [Methylosoma difficile]
MQVSVEKTSELSRKMTVVVPEEVVQAKMAEKLKSLAREVKIDGFRKGKVPQTVVKKLYGDRVRGEVAGDLIQTTYFEAIQTEDLKPAGQPFIDSVDESQGFKYTAVFEVYPEVVLDGLDQLQVSRAVSDVEESDVDAMIQKLREQRKEWAEATRASQTGDRITVSFTGSSEDENFTDGLVENYQVELGAKQMIPGFEDNLIGLEVGASKTFELNFPEDYGNTKLAGKAAKFAVDVIKIEEPSFPEIDEEFVKLYGIEDGSLDAFRKDVRENMERELAQALRNKLKTSAMDALYEKIQLTLPNTLVDEEIESLMKPYMETAKRQNVKAEDLKLPREMFEDQAKRRVALGMILGEIIQKNNITLDKDKVRATIEDMSKSYERPEDVVKWYYSDESRLNDIQQMVLEDQTVEWLLAQATVTDEPVKFNDVMDRQSR